MTPSSDPHRSRVVYFYSPSESVPVLHWYVMVSLGMRDVSETVSEGSRGKKGLSKLRACKLSEHAVVE